MKVSSMMKRQSIASYALSTAVALLLFTSCSKDDSPPIESPSSIPSTVLDKWMTVQFRLMKNSTGIANHALARHMAYSGVAAVEALKPGFINQGWSSKWNGLTGLPNPDNSKKYYFPANVNAAMASMNRLMFPNANATDKAAIDSLENALNAEFLQTEKKSKLDQSAEFGQAVAVAVYNWAETDGYKNANAPYTVPVGPGIWKPTPPGFAAPATPYWGNNRPIVSGSLTDSHVPAPTAYSTAPGSPFYTMVNLLYTTSQNLTDDQKAMAIFWRDVPGATTPGHWLNIVRQAVKQKNAPLDQAAIAYAATGIAINDALIACFKAKYQYNLVRPITYIREIMEQTSWNTVITTPAHPEYPSAHASLSSAAGEALQRVLGSSGTFTDHTYDYLGFAPRTFNSYIAIGHEAGWSRLYAGIHYDQTIKESIAQGKKVTDNIFGGQAGN